MVIGMVIEDFKKLADWCFYVETKDSSGDSHLITEKKEWYNHDALYEVEDSDELYQVLLGIMEVQERLESLRNHIERKLEMLAQAERKTLDGYN